MKITPQLHCEAPSSSNEVRAEVLFVDLDETILDGTVCEMSDEELDEAGVIQATINLIQKAKAQGIPVVMVTRNKNHHIDRFFESKPELRSLFDEIISCQGEKSHLINCDLLSRGINPEHSLFIDDNPTEIEDVGSLGVQTILPQSTDQIVLVKPKITEEKVTDITRYKARNTLGLLYADNIALAA